MVNAPLYQMFNWERKNSFISSYYWRHFVLNEACDLVVLAPLGQGDEINYFNNHFLPDYRRVCTLAMLPSLPGLSHWCGFHGPQPHSWVTKGEEKFIPIISSSPICYVTAANLKRGKGELR